WHRLFILLCLMLYFPTIMSFVVGNNWSMLFLMENTLQLPSGYPALLEELKHRIRSAQLRAAFAVNRELLLLYWSIGRDILNRQQAEGWGTKVIDRLAKDLQ